MRHYFPSLNALRFYAAISIVIGHIYGYSGQFEPNRIFGMWLEPFLMSGTDAVTLFFVLSGFLITTILLNEQIENGTINVRSFYLRRARRILPLYILATVLSFAAAPILSPLYGRHYDLLGLLSTVMLSGHIGLAFGMIGLTGHFWSIGIEEWFYATIPNLLKRWRVPIIVAAVFIARYSLILVTAPDALTERYNLSPWEDLLIFSRFDAMALGALAAWFFKKRHPVLKLIYKLESLTVVLMLILIALPVADMGGALYDTVVAIISMSLILNVSTNPHTWVKLEHPLINALGQRSYGLYMLHPIVTFILSPLFPNNVLLLVLIPLTTIATASLSYRYLEQPFLKPPLAERISNTT